MTSSEGSRIISGTNQSVTELRGSNLYNILKKCILSEHQLRMNGFPRPHPDGEEGHAKIYVINSRNHFPLSEMPNERICNRCGKRYAIDEQGFALRPEKCIYHWGKKYRSDDEYSCCRRRGLAVGCTYAVTHVWEYTDYENLRGYVKTLPKDTPAEEQGIYALDCEMSYTTRGLKVTSVTVVNENGCVVYQTLVRPESPILDYNTRYSGITEEDMRNVTTTLADVQKTMLTMFSEKTILVGHGLENDLRSLQLLHDTVIDTTVIFPHRQGYPNKRALKNICAEFLRKTIQNDASGHDSKEDAVSCMELIFWKAKCIVDAKPW